MDPIYLQDVEATAKAGPAGAAFEAMEQAIGVTAAGWRWRRRGKELPGTVSVKQ